MMTETLDPKVRGVGTLYAASGCCGMAEYYGINNSQWTPEGTLALLRTRVEKHTTGNPGMGVLLFVHRQHGLRSKDWRSDRLRQMQRYVRKHGLGTFHITKGTKNPNSGNMLFTGVWCIDKGALRAHVIPRKTKPTVSFTAPVAA